MSCFWFVLLLIIPGGVAGLAAFRKGWLVAVRSWSELFFLSFLGSFSLFSLTALALAQLGIFSIYLVGAVLLLYSLLVLVLLKPSPVRIRIVPPVESAFSIRRGKQLPPLIFLIILTLAALLYFRPTEYIFGGWDPGVYAGTGAHLARSGSLPVDDRRPDFISARERLLFSRVHSGGYLEKYPGFRRAGPEGERLIPQFYHLYPALLAAAIFPAGPAGGFYLTPLLGLFSLIAIYLLVGELWGRPAALAAVFLIAINLIQIWQARFPTAEMLSQFLLFSGLFLLARFLGRSERYAAALAGVLLGLFLLSHITALLLLPVLLGFFYCRWFIAFRREDLDFLVPFLILAGYSLLPNLLYGREYAGLSLGRLPVPGWAGLLPVLAAAAGLAALRLADRDFRRRVVAWLPGRHLGRAACVLTVLLAVYAYFIRPLGPGLSADKTNLVELSWFLTPLGLFLALVGICLLLLENRRPAVGVFLLLTLIFSLVFLWRQMISPYYMWAARRFAVVIIPGLLICAVYPLGRLGRSRRPVFRAAAALLFLLLAFLQVRRSRVLFAHQEYRGAAAFLEELAGRVASADLVAVGAAVDKLPGPLDLVYGLPILPIYPEAAGQWREVIEFSRRETSGGRVIYLLAAEDPGEFEGVELRPEGELLYHVPLLERSGVRPPSGLDFAAPDGRIAVKIFRVIQKED